MGASDKKRTECNFNSHIFLTCAYAYKHNQSRKHSLTATGVMWAGIPRKLLLFILLIFITVRYIIQITMGHMAKGLLVEREKNSIMWERVKACCTIRWHFLLQFAPVTQDRTVDHKTADIWRRNTQKRNKECSAS